MYVSIEAEVSLLHTPQSKKEPIFYAGKIQRYPGHPAPAVPILFAGHLSSTCLCYLDIDAGFLIFRISITACLLFTAIAKTSTHAVISLQILTVILHFRLENGFK